jgi:hypothetical protein
MEAAADRRRRRSVVVRPDNAANWQLRAQVQLMFPK